MRLGQALILSKRRFFLSTLSLRGLSSSTLLNEIETSTLKETSSKADTVTSVSSSRTSSLSLSETTSETTQMSTSQTTSIEKTRRLTFAPISWQQPLSRALSIPKSPARWIAKSMARVAKIKEGLANQAKLIKEHAKQKPPRQMKRGLLQYVKKKSWER
jgi:hypothetical protein